MNWPWANKNYRITTIRIMVMFFFAIGPSYAGVASEMPQAASVVDFACDKIFKGDFESARQILGEPAVSDSYELVELRKIIDEYTVIKERRKSFQDKLYQTQINMLDQLRRKVVSGDANDTGEVFSVVLNILEYADEKQKQALLRDALLIETIKKAQSKAAKFEADGKWFDAYTVCYSKLRQIYDNDKIYSDHAKELLAKADIRMSLQDSPCQSCEQRYSDIEKQVFIKAVDFLDHRYIKIVDYQDMAIKAINRCELLAEVMSRLEVNNKYKITDEQYAVWSQVLREVLNRINESQIEIGKDEFIDIFEAVLALNESPHAEAGLSKLLVAQFAKGALSALDPYTAIYWPNQVQDFEKALTNQFSGIGIKFSKQEGLAKIVTVFPDTPAYKSGLQMGDIIMAVDGIETIDISSDCLAKKITGPEDTKVRLKIKRPSEDEICDISLDRTNVVVPSVQGWQRNEKGKWLYFIDGSEKIGYVRISSFNSRTADDFEKVLYQLEENGLKGLVLDLRSNPGGLLSAAVEIADKFIPEGLIVRVQPRCGMSTYISAHQQGTCNDYPIVVLVNQSTASASEILAGVLQDAKYKRAVLVGQKTYGKGSVQSITDCCGKGTQLKYTAAFYYLPSGQRVESRDLMKKSGRTDWGILPDVNVQLNSDEIKKISDTTRVDDDLQLATGLLVLKSKMIQARNELEKLR